MSLKEQLVTKSDILEAVPELLTEINSIQKMKKDSSRIQFGQIQKLMWEYQQASLLEAVGFPNEANLVREFFGTIDPKDYFGGIGTAPAINSYAGLMVPHIMGEKIKSVDDIICEIFEKKTVDIEWYRQ